MCPRYSTESKKNEHFAFLRVSPAGNYYGKFLPDLASVLAPLYQYALLQKKKWKWGAKQQQAFDHVKNLSRVRVHFDDKLPLVLSCDASPYGVGAVLSHVMANGDERPICYTSRTLSETEKKYSQLDKELWP